MARTVASLAVSIVAKTKGLQKGLKSATASVSAFSISTAKHLASLAVGGATALFAFTKNISDMVDNLGDLGDRVGLNVNQMLRLQQSFGRAGVGTEAFVKSLSKLQLNAAKARDGNKEMAEAFRNLGIDVGDFLRLGAEDQLRAMADGFAKITDKSTRATIAALVFGKSWESILPVLSGGSEALDEAGKSATAFGDLTARQLKDLAAFDDQWIKSTGIMKSFFIQLGAQLAGPGAGLLKFITDFTSKGLMGLGMMATDIKELFTGKDFGASMDKALPEKLAADAASMAADGVSLASDAAKITADLSALMANESARLGESLGMPTISAQNVIIKTGAGTFESRAGEPTFNVPSVQPAAEQEQKKIVVLLQEGNRIWSETRDAVRNGVPAVAQ